MWKVLSLAALIWGIVAITYAVEGLPPLPNNAVLVHERLLSCENPYAPDSYQRVYQTHVGMAPEDFDRSEFGLLEGRVPGAPLAVVLFLPGEESLFTDLYVLRPDGTVAHYTREQQEDVARDYPNGVCGFLREWRRVKQARV